MNKAADAAFAGAEYTRQHITRDRYMKRLLILATLSLTFAAGSTLAQDTPPPTAPPAAAAAPDGMAPPPPPGGPEGEMRQGEMRQGEMREGEMREGEMRHGDMRPDDKRPHEMRPHEMRDGEMRRWDKGPRGPDGRRPPPPSKAAHYRVETDDIKIDLKCAEDEPPKACADLLMSTIDRLGLGRD
jgi:hypothetical protein